MKQLLVLLPLLFSLLASPVWPVEFRADSTNSGTGTAISVSAPAGTTDGDIVLVFVASNNLVTLADNNGGTPFTEDVADIQDTSGTWSLFSRRIVGGDPSTYNFTTSSSNAWRAYAVASSNPHPSIIFDTTPGSACNTAANTVTTAAQTTSSENALIYQFFGVDITTTITFSNPPSGYTMREEVSTDRAMAVYSKNKTPAGVESAQSITYDGASQNDCGIVASLEAAAGAGGVRRRNF